MEDELTFERALTELEAAVNRLEEGDLTLEDSLKLFERGQKLARFCQEYLEQATLRIEYLTEDGEIALLAEEEADS